MKKMISLILAVAIALSMAAFPANADADLSIDYWDLHLEPDGKASLILADNAATVQIAECGVLPYSVALIGSGLSLSENGYYWISFDISSSIPCDVEWMVLDSARQNRVFVQDTIHLVPEVQTITAEFSVEADAPYASLVFDLGGMDLGAHNVSLSNVMLENITGVDGAYIRVNQVGYRPNDAKKAVLMALYDKTFDVVDADSGKVVYTGTVEAWGSDAGYEGLVGWADFSAVTQPGSYYIRTENLGYSHSFEIADNVYEPLLKSALKMLYLQRCGMDLTEEYAGAFAHTACHTSAATIQGTKTTMDVTGGWHDAGDYGRYTVPGCKAAADLLLAYEMNPNAFDDAVGIPESGNGIPDVLDEARYELEWLLKMQHKDGYVFHQVSSVNFASVVMPDEDNRPLVVTLPSSTASGDFTAVMFIASRVYRNIDSKFAKQCLKAAKKALKDIEEYYTEVFIDPNITPDSTYFDDSAYDEYLWAMCEGYNTLGSLSLKKYFLEKDIQSFDFSSDYYIGLGWADVGSYAYYADMNGGHLLPKAEFADYLSETRKLIENDAFHSTIEGTYPWGSNMLIANDGVMLLMEQKQTGNPEDTAMAHSLLDYLLGVNPTGYCYVTGFGSQSPQNPHHRPSMSIGQAMPGMLVGGPNSNGDDTSIASMAEYLIPAACYLDTVSSYSTNEVTIYWNSPLIWLISGLM